MTRRPFIILLVATALAAWVQVSGRTRSRRAAGRFEMKGNQDRPAGDVPAEPDTVVILARPRPRERVSAAGSRHVDSIVDRTAPDHGTGDWSTLVEQLDGVLARCAALGLDSLLDLDFGGLDGVRTTAVPDVSTAPVRRGPDVTPETDYVPAGLGPGPDVSPSARAIVAMATSRAAASDGGPTPTSDRVPQAAAEETVRRQSSPAVLPREDVACDDAGCDDGDPCTLDRCGGATCVHERLRGGARVCELRGLVMARQRLLDAAPAAAFLDAPSRSRVQVRLGRALRLVDRALSRVEEADVHGRPAPRHEVARRVAGYEKRVGSRIIERRLVDPALTRALHFPVAGLAPFR